MIKKILLFTLVVVSLSSCLKNEPIAPPGPLDARIIGHWKGTRTVSEDDLAAYSKSLSYNYSPANIEMLSWVFSADITFDTNFIGHRATSAVSRFTTSDEIEWKPNQDSTITLSANDSVIDDYYDTMKCFYFAGDDEYLAIRYDSSLNIVRTFDIYNGGVLSDSIAYNYTVAPKYIYPNPEYTSYRMIGNDKLVMNLYICGMQIGIELTRQEN